MTEQKICLMVVDMQGYYLKRESAYCRYFNHIQPGSLDYILKRCEDMVTPRTRTLIDFFHQKGMPVLFLRLCGKKDDRSDLHPFFRETNGRAASIGFHDVYPLATDPMSEVIPELAPADSDIVITKTTFSAFTSSAIDHILKNENIGSIAFAGLAASQCVETSARDASDRGYRVINLIDCQADYDEATHRASLISSQGVCGGIILTAAEFIENFESLVADVTAHDIR